MNFHLGTVCSCDVVWLFVTNFPLQFKLYGNHCCCFSTVQFVQLSLLLRIDAEVVDSNEVNIGDLRVSRNIPAYTYKIDLSGI